MPALPNHPDDAERGFVVGALGRRLRIRVTGPGSDALVTAFARAWAALLLDPCSETDHELTLSTWADSPDSIAAALADASARITRTLIDLNAGRGLLFHAAAVVGHDGRAILLVGPSGAGKTTAVTRLAGANGYLTDETVLVGHDGRVIPYPKPLSVDRGGSAKLQLAPGELGLRVAEGASYEVGRVVVLNRGPGTPGAPRTRRLDLIESIQALVPQLSGLEHHPAPIGAIAELIRRLGGIELLSYTDVGELDPAGLPLSPPLSAEEVAFSTVIGGTDDHAAAGSGLIRTRASDAVETADVLVLAHGSAVRALAGIAKTLWLTTDEARAEDALLERLRAVHGAAPGDERALRGAIDDLVRAGVLEWRS